jgi:capsular exopolysaccharide synthesis family protein
MNPSAYLTALRRRWIDLVVAVGVALLAGWVITSTVAPPTAPTTTYKATAFLVGTGPAYSAGSTNLQALAALTTVGEVPERVGKVLDSKEHPLTLASQVKASASTETGILRISATSEDRVEAATLANTFAGELVSFLRDQRATTVSSEGRELQNRLDDLDGQIDALDRQIASASASEATVIQAERDALIRQYGLIYESYQQVANSAATQGGLQIVQEGVPRPVAQTGFQVPQSRLSRMVIAGILGLISGIVLVLALDRFDSRIRGRKDAEKHFGYPVLAEIPFVSRRKRGQLALAVKNRPRSPTADAFRILSMVLSVRGLPESDGEGNGNGHAKLQPDHLGRSREDTPRVVLVTSPGPADGKTTLVANLAASLAERGKRVIVMSLDLRRPRIHRLLGVGNSSGLADRLGETYGDGPLLYGLVRRTAVDGVRIVTSGPPPTRPGELLASPGIARALAEAKERADIVLVDSAPVLTTSDATALVGQVDTVLLVARAGRTTAEVAERASGVLRRLGAPVSGIALNAAREMASPRRYYHYYYGESEAKASDWRKGFPRLLRLSKKA